MVDAGCNFDIVIYGIMVDIFCKAGRVDEVVDIVKSMDVGGYILIFFIYSILVYIYGVENRIEDVIDIFLEMVKNGVEVDVVVYNVLISVFCKVNKFENVFRVLREMDGKGIILNVRICNIILNSLIGQGLIDEVFRVFRKMIKVCDFDVDIYILMIKMFFDKDQGKMVLKVWKYMKLKRFILSMYIYFVFINGLCEKGEVSDVCIFMEEMIEKGI